MMEQELAILRAEMTDFKKSIKNILIIGLTAILTITGTTATFVFINTGKINQNEIRSITNEDKIDILQERAVSNDKLIYTTKSLKNLLDKIIAISEGDEKKFQQAQKEYEHLENLILSDGFGINYRGHRNDK